LPSVTRVKQGGRLTTAMYRIVVHSAKSRVARQGGSNGTVVGRIGRLATIDKTITARFSAGPPCRDEAPSFGDGDVEKPSAARVLRGDSILDRRERVGAAHMDIVNGA
jgi:hypothetical protein